VIGTGASAIQFVPRIQPGVAELHIYQRTAPWIMPHPDRPTTRLPQVVPDLSLKRKRPGPARVERKRKRIKRRRYVTLTTRVRVLTPGAANVARSGELTVEIEQTYPLEQYAEALNHAKAYQRKGKVMFILGEIDQGSYRCSTT
jgi:cation diffusion facilitator CzcD-associated flavoprotein CzcO